MVLFASIMESDTIPAYISMVWKDRICHYVSWQIRPFDTNSEQMI